MAIPDWLGRKGRNTLDGSGLRGVWNAWKPWLADWCYLVLIIGCNKRTEFLCPFFVPRANPICQYSAEPTARLPGGPPRRPLVSYVPFRMTCFFNPELLTWKFPIIASMMFPRRLGGPSRAKQQSGPYGAFATLSQGEGFGGPEAPNGLR